MNKLKKFALITLIIMTFSGTVYAAKWKELVFTDDINMGLAELSQYCMLHNITVADVLWANSVESNDLKPGQSLYLPANHADMLAIWQNRGAWKPTALVPVTSAAAAKRAASNETLTTQTTQTMQAPAPLTPVTPAVPATPVTPAPVTVPEVKPEIKPEEPQKTNDELIAQLRDEVRTDARNLPASNPVPAPAPAPVMAQTKPETQELQPVQTVQNKPAPVRTQERPDPAKVIANTAKPDKILTSTPRKSAKNDIPGLMDPIIILSPNGDPSKGPMRLVISGDKVEVVQLPKNAAPKRPSLADLDHTFGATPSYLPHYNLTPRQRARDPFIINMGNLAGKMLWPVDGKISSPFGKWRGKHKHQGIDIPMPAGTPIRASRNGVITRTGNNSTMGFRGYGNFVLMDHGDGLQTFYAHCLSVAVIQGQRVMQGQIIGYVGSTGRSTANHLHFEVRVNNVKVDPIPYLAGNTHLASRKQ